MNPEDIAKKYGASFTPTAPVSNALPSAVNSNTDSNLSSMASKYGATFTPTPVIPSPTVTKPLGFSDTMAGKGFNNVSKQINDAKNAGIEQVKGGFQMSAESANPLVKIAGATKGLAGVVNTVFSPLAPVFKPIGDAINYVGEKAGDIKALQEFARSPVGNLATKVTDFTQDLLTVTGAVAGARSMMEAKPTAPNNGFTEKTSIPTPSENAPLPKIIQKRIDVLNTLDDTYAQLRKAKGFSSDEGVASKQRIASTDVLANSVDENGVIRTKDAGGAIDQYKAMTLDNAEGVIRKNLVQEGSKTNLSELQIRLEDSINKSGLEGADLKIALNKVKQEISGLKLRADPNGDIPNAILQDAKINTTNNINYQTPPEVSTYRKAIARGYKETIEKNSNLNIKEVNGELSKYLSDISLLERLDGKRVQGGKLGKYFAQISGNIIGGATGTAVGGPIGSAVGTIVGGELGSRIKGNIMSKTFGKSTGRTATQSPIITEAINRVKSPTQENSVGSLNQQYNPTPTISKNETINNSIPRNTKEGGYVNPVKMAEDVKAFLKSVPEYGLIKDLKAWTELYDFGILPKGEKDKLSFMKNVRSQLDKHGVDAFNMSDRAIADFADAVLDKTKN